MVLLTVPARAETYYVDSTTGNDGKIAIRIRHGAMQLISASVETPLADGKADTVIRASTLQFELPK